MIGMAGEYGESADGTVSHPPEKVSFFKKAWIFLGTENAKNLNRSLFNTFLLLAIYFLGANAMIWTVDQVKVYSDQLCDYSSFSRINATAVNISSWGNAGVLQVK